MSAEPIERTDVAEPATKPDKCTHPGCKNAYKSRGYCTTHYERLLVGLPLDRPNIRTLKTMKDPLVPTEYNANLDALLTRRRRLGVPTDGYPVEELGFRRGVKLS